MFEYRSLNRDATSYRAGKTAVVVVDVLVLVFFILFF